MPLKKARSRSKTDIQAAVSANIRTLRKEHPEWTHKRVVAAAVRAAEGGR